MTTLLTQHLLDSSVFALLALLLARCLRRAGAASRHTLLLAAVAKFALPLSAVFAAGEALRALLPVHAVASPPAVLLYTVQVAAAAPSSRTSEWIFGALVLWLAGAVLLFARWCWLLVRPANTRTVSTPEELAALGRAQQRLGVLRPVALRTAPGAAQPYLAGILHPAIILPVDLAQRLTPREFEAVLQHELAHLARHDNLALTAVHVITCLFWFHPLLWWLERRVRIEGESACDELVLAAGVAPHDYIRGICKSCYLALLRPVGGRSYVSNSNFKQRLERIMSKPQPTFTAPILRVVCVLVLPLLLLSTLVIGTLASHAVHAQSSSAADTTAPDLSCVVAGAHLPQGTVIQHADHLQLCTFSKGLVRWISTNKATRDKSRPVIAIDDAPPISCTPTAPVGNLCTCSNLSFSPGAVVGSPNGMLVCPQTDGHWQPYTLAQAAPPRGSETSIPSPDAAGLYKVGNGVIAPVLTHSVEPEFPEAARKRKLNGNVLVTLIVGTDGQPRDVRVLRSAGDGKPPKDQKLYATLDGQALKAVQQYRFKPGLLRGNPVPVKLNVEVNFQIF